jgi:hypothetical protein
MKAQATTKGGSQTKQKEQASGSSLTNGDWGFCILGVQCSDGQYLTDSHRATTTCSVTCAAGQHAQSIDIEVGVNP